jgi:hypothetical protein
MGLKSLLEIPQRKISGQVLNLIEGLLHVLFLNEDEDCIFMILPLNSQKLRVVSPPV